MFRIAKLPVVIPDNVKIKLNNQEILVQGKKGELLRKIHPAVDIQYFSNQLTCLPRKGYSNGWALAGTTRALLNCMIIGVNHAFTKNLQLIGVGYRVVVENNIINLFLGFSHTIEYKLPPGITAKCPSQTEIVLEGVDKQAVGQVAADLRAYRCPEPYKGKGIRYTDEIVHIKEAKKK